MLKNKNRIITVSFLCIIAAISTSTSQVSLWKQINGTRWQATGKMIEDKTGNLYLYANNGLWISKDNGSEWEKTLFPKPVGCFAADSLDNVYVGTGTGVYKLSDHGNNWTSLGLESAGIYTLLIKSDSIIFAGGYPYVYRSTNSGSTWETVNNNIVEQDDFLSLALTSHGNILLGNAHMGVYLSTDNGNSWNRVLTDIEASPPINCIVRNNAGLIFCGTYGGIYISQDDGLTWSKNDSSLATSYVLNIVASKSGVLLAEAVNDGAYRSDDGGMHWNKINFPYQYGPTIFAASNNKLFIGTPDLYCSNDDGITWELLASQLTNRKFFSIAVKSVNEVYIGTNDGCYLSTNQGIGWKRIFLDSINQHVSTILSDSVYGVLVGTIDGKIYKVDSLGTKWKRLSSPVKDTVINSDIIKVSIINSICIDKQANIFVGGIKGIYLSTDQGNSWIERNNVINGKEITDLITDGTRLICGTLGFGLYFSTDKGINWQKPQDTLSNGYISSLLRVDDTVLYVGTYVNLTDNGELFKTTNWGISWERVNIQPFDIACDSRGNIYLGTAVGVYYSDNGGKKWSPAGQTFPWSNFIVAVATDEKGFVYALDEFSGIYKSIAPIVTKVSNSLTALPHVLMLSQNYPNPFNPATTISFDLPKSSLVSLVVYDCLGRKVSVLLNEYRMIGHHDVFFKPNNLASGVYFYELKSDNFISIKKMLLVK